MLKKKKKKTGEKKKETYTGAFESLRFSDLGNGDLFNKQVWGGSQFSEGVGGAKFSYIVSQLGCKIKLLRYS